MKRSLGDLLFSDILSNQYLSVLYLKLIDGYFRKILLKDCETEITEKEKTDLLRFADILSKSTMETKRDNHNNIAQSIVSMLSSLFLGDDAVNYYKGSVLSNVNNYLGLDKNTPDYYSRDMVEFLKEQSVREKYLVPCSNDLYFINMQRLAFERIKENDFYSFSAPTSMGKTFLIRMYIREQILNGVKQNFAIVVPSKALINEVSNNIICDLADNLREQGYRVVTSSASIDVNENCNYVMVYTQERLLHHLLKLPQVVIPCVFIDEAHKISNADGRSPFFYKALKVLQSQSYEIKVCFSCPNIPNPEVYLDTLGGPGNRASNRFTYSPVNQCKAIIDFNSDSCLLYNELAKKFEVCKLKPSIIFQKDASIVDVVDEIGRGQFNLIFCNSKREVVERAVEYCKKLENKPSKELDDLIEDIKDEIHEDCYLIKTLKKGVAYHVSYLPTNIKEKIEKLFRAGEITTVFCTSTLLEGVNFPADNLFIMLKSNSHWLKSYNRANFKNLMGRVGRVDLNLFGNVFCISQDNNAKEYTEAISQEIEKQELSLSELTLNRKKDIIKTLLDGKTTLAKRSTDNFNDLNFHRKVLSILLKEIVGNIEGVVSKSFDGLLTDNVRQGIKEAFERKKDIIPNDLLVTMDQVELLDHQIKKNALGFPEEVSHKNILAFLQSLYQIFKWENYEPKNELGGYRGLSYYALLANQWMNGFGMKQIIGFAIDHAKVHGVWYEYEGELKPFNNSDEQKNIVISDVLNNISDILQFKLSNYFQKFSERLMSFKGVQSLQNDWYEFIEFGTNNYIVIKLQKYGFSRDAANYIFREKNFAKSGETFKVFVNNIKPKKYLKEVEIIKFNHPEILVFSN